MGRGRIRRTNSLYQTTTPAFHTLVCRHQPAWAIAMKACPGLRSGIDRSGSLSFAIRGIPSSIRPPNRHSGEGRNPGEGRPAHPCHIESLWAVQPQPTVLVRSQFANAQDKLRSNLNSYSTTIPPSGACLFDSTCLGYGNGWPVVVSTSRARLSASDRYADSISARFKRASEAPTGGGFRSIRLRKHDSK